jgi:hypothetical protein
MSMLYGVDVHDGYQAGLDFSLLVRQGYAFCAVKLTEGTSYARAAGDDWVRAARAAGLIPGGYHWIKRGNGAAQAQWFLSKVKESGGPDGMLIQLDCEDDASFADILDWRDEWNRLTGGHPFLLYTGSWWWSPRGWSGTTVTPYLWQSHYLTADLDSVPDDPAAFAARIPASWWVPGYGGWPTATILQFTSKGDAGGLANKVDLNVYRGSREQLLALTHSGGVPIGDDDVLSDPQNNALAEDWAMAIALRDGVSAPAAGNHPGGTTWAVTVLNEIKAAVSKPAPVTVDADAVAAALAGNTAFLAALAKAVNDDLHARTAQ